MTPSEITIGLASNIIASIVFLFILLIALKPKIAISDIICKNSGYQIQIVNKSIFKAFDINVQLWSCLTIPATADTESDSTYTRITLVVDSIFRVPPRPWIFGKQKTYQASRFRTHEDLTKMLSEPNTTIIFMMSAKHGLSGLTETFIKGYKDTTKIENGSFETGAKINSVKKIS